MLISVRCSRFLIAAAAAMSVATAAAHAEEITVTIPPDPVPVKAAPKVQAAPQSQLPSFTGGNFGNAPQPAKTAVPQVPAAQAAPVKATVATPTAPVKQQVIKEAADDTATAQIKEKLKKPAAAAASDKARAEKKSAGSATKETEKKTKQASTTSSCKGLEKDACGSAKGCRWIVPQAVKDTGKAEAPHCGKKKAKTDTAKANEVLPWAKPADAASAGSGGWNPDAVTTSTVDTDKSKKKKTSEAKKTKEIVPPIPASSGQ